MSILQSRFLAKIQTNHLLIWTCNVYDLLSPNREGFQLEPLFAVKHSLVRCAIAFIGSNSLTYYHHCAYTPITGLFRCTGSGASIYWPVYFILAHSFCRQSWKHRCQYNNRLQQKTLDHPGEVGEGSRSSLLDTIAHYDWFLSYLLYCNVRQGQY